MKIPHVLCLLALLLSVALVAAPLPQTTAIHNQPDSAAPVVGFLKAGSEPTAAAGVDAPAGWMAVTLPGPHDVFVHNDELTKDLKVRPGAEMRLRPEDNAPVLATMKAGDKVDITGLRPGWTQLKFSGDAVGYIRTGGEPPPAPSEAPAPPAPAAGSPTVAPPPAVPSGGVVPAGSGTAAALPSTSEGFLEATRRFLLVGPKPDYPYQLNDTNGKRIAYLDVSQIQPTVSMQKYLDSFVSVSGVLKQTEDGRHLVIVVDSLHQK